MPATLHGAGPVVVTGASGFLGRHLCGHLADAGAQVRSVSRRSVPQAGVTPHRIADLADRPALAAAVSGARAVVHLAARAHVSAEAGSDATEVAERYHRVNTEGTRVVLEEAERAGVRQFIFASSVKAVGAASGDVVWDESTDARPADPYGRSKRAAEELVLSGEADGMDRIVLRLPLVYGPGVKANMRALLGAVDRRIPLPLGGIRNRRSMLYVGNFTAAVGHLLDREGLGWGTYFLSDGEDLSTPDLVRRIARALGRRPVLIPVPESVLRAVGRLGDAARRVVPVPVGSPAIERLTSSLAVDARAFNERFGFAPPYSVDEGLAETARWFRQSKKAGP